MFSGKYEVAMDTFFDKNAYIYLMFESKTGIRCTATAFFKKSYQEEKAMKNNNAFKAISGLALKKFGRIMRNE